MRGPHVTSAEQDCRHVVAQLVQSFCKSPESVRNNEPCDVFQGDPFRIKGFNEFQGLAEKVPGVIAVEPLSCEGEGLAWDSANDGVNACSAQVITAL